MAVANVRQDFYVNCKAPEFPVANGDGMENRKGAGGTNSSISGHSVNLKNKTASKITGGMLQSQTCQDLSHFSRKNEQGLGYSQVTKNENSRL